MSPLLRRRLILGLAGGILGLELLWVAAFEWAARSGRLERWVARRPDRFVLRFESARSFLPFHVRLSGAHLAGQTANWRWSVDAGTIDAEIAPWPLFARRLEVSRARGDGVTVRAGRRADAPNVAPSTARPEIPDFDAATESSRPPARSPWSYVFRDLEANRIGEVWIEELRFTGAASASGGFAFRRRREAEILPSEVAVLEGAMTLAGATIAPRLTGRASGRITPYEYRRERGLAVLQHVEAGAEFSGEIVEGVLLRPWLGRLSWLELEDLPAAFDSSFRLSRGALAPGSRLTAERPRRRIGVFGFDVTGEGQLLFEVSRDDRGPRGDLTLRYDEYDVRRASAERPDVVGHGFAVALLTRELTVGRVPADAKVEIDLGEARMADLASLQGLLPRSSGIRLLGGSGGLTGHLEADLETGVAVGKLASTIEEARLSWSEREMAGRVAIEVPVASRDLAARSFDLSGSSVDLSGFRLKATGADAEPAADGWWARARFPRLTLSLAPGGELAGTAVCQLRDSVPLVELYGARRDLPGWVEKLLTVEDIEVRSELRWRRGSIRVDGIETALREATIRARLELAPDARHGDLLLEWKKLAVGVEVANGRRDLKLRGARAWFDGKTPPKSGF